VVTKAMDRIRTRPAHIAGFLTVLLLLGTGSVGGEAFQLNTGGVGTPTVPSVFLPLAPKFASSPIPVFFPTWLPRLPGKLYPGFSTFKRQYGAGPGYVLGLYTSAQYQDHAHRLFGLTGIAGADYAVNTHTEPVWLGKHGWAYVDPGGNAGSTISLVRAVRQSMWPPEYTYTVVGGCAAPAGMTPARLTACLKRIAASMQRYTARSSGQ